MEGRNGGKLNPFKKGQSGNPKGRPKLPDIKKALALVMADEQNGKTALDAVLMALRAKAVKGDVRAAELLLDRAYGKLKNNHEVELNVIRVKVKPEDADYTIPEVE